MKFMFILIIMLTSCVMKQKPTVTILSGSENETVAKILSDYAETKGVELNFTYDGSVNIMRTMTSADVTKYDLVWPASTMWLSLGDGKKVVKKSQSAFVSPVVLAIKAENKKALGWNNEITTEQLVKAVQGKQLIFAMTSATQSNSGAAAYLALLQSLSKKSEPFTEKDLEKESLQNDIKTILSGVNRSSGSSGWLKNMALSQNLEAWINYESMVIEANRQLVTDKKEPYQVIYISDATSVSDSPLSLISSDPTKAKIYEDLLQYLNSDAGQSKLLAAGRRTSSAMFSDSYPLDVFNTSWGVQTTKIYKAMTYPTNQTVFTAFKLYQELFRKPSLTAYCLDFSGSMEGQAEVELKEAVKSVLSTDSSSQFMIQPSIRDVNLVYRFDSKTKFLGEVTGTETKDLVKKVLYETSSGGTDMYSCLSEALTRIAEINKVKPVSDYYIPAIIVMTDGRSDNNQATYVKSKTDTSLLIPVYSITFGTADNSQLESLAKDSYGKVFDGNKNLQKAFVTVKGYN